MVVKYMLPSDIRGQLIQKAEAHTDPQHGCPPHQRAIPELLDKGIIILDKPANPTSHEVAAWVRNILRIKKTGHGGTLDPAVTGILPITLGRATRINQVLLPAGKEYVCVMETHRPVPESQVQHHAKFFEGKIYQKPPVRSSVKRQLRVREIYYLKIIQVVGKFVLFRVGCQAGTYIRKLCHDLGLVLGVGAHMKELRRTRSGPFSEKDLVSLQDVYDAATAWFEDSDDRLLRKVVRPMEDAVEHLPKIIVRDTAVDAICHGAKVSAPGIVAFSSNITPGSMVAIMTLKKELIAIGTALVHSQQVRNMTKGFCARPITVLMERGTYPRKW